MSVVVMCMGCPLLPDPAHALAKTENKGGPSQPHPPPHPDLVKGYHQIPVTTEDIPKLQSKRHLACLNICSPLLGCPTPHEHFRE
jgi:hypothetical protein